jgi:hypothetical protein
MKGEVTEMSYDYELQRYVSGPGRTRVGSVLSKHRAVLQKLSVSSGLQSRDLEALLSDLFLGCLEAVGEMTKSAKRELFREFAEEMAQQAGRRP